MVEGRLTPDRATGGPRIWTAQDGTPRASFELNADSVVFLQGRTEGYGGGGGAEDQGGGPDYVAEDEIPF